MYSHARPLCIKVRWDPFHPDLIASATNMDLKQTMLATKVPVNLQKGGQCIRTQITEVSSDGRKVTMSEEGGEPFQINSEGQDTATGLLTLREATERILERPFNESSPPWYNFLDSQKSLTPRSWKERHRRRAENKQDGPKYHILFGPGSGNSKKLIPPLGERTISLIPNLLTLKRGNKPSWLCDQN